ncbi:MAG: hypothetical protein HY710_11495 [Candidatus Latescibacteria bacterium]|nr:hypothetical protein [Candidatus Latescibacterota bacterium]
MEHTILFSSISHARAPPGDLFLLGAGSCSLCAMADVTEAETLRMELGSAAIQGREAGSGGGGGGEDLVWPGQ